MKSSLISIIVPVYNGASYIERCIKSITNQTYKNIEIIIVNDGSTDETKSVCEELIKKDNRIKIINSENRGVSHARNIAIKESGGEYIGFVDADDYIESKMYEDLVHNAQRYDAQISICGWTNTDKFEEENESIRIIRDNNEAINELFYNDNINGFLCNKLYRRDVIFNDKNKFILLDEEIKILEDLLYNYEVLKKCERLVYTNNKYYHYIINSGSAINSKFSYKNVTGLQALQQIINDFDRNFYNKKLIIKLKYEFCCLYYKSIYIFEHDKEVLEQRYKHNVDIYYKTIIKSKEIYIRKKVRVAMARFLPIILFGKRG